MRSHLLWNVSWVLIVFFQFGCMLNASISNLQSVTNESTAPSVSPSPPSPEPTPSVTTTLKLTGNSSAQADASLRVFDETQSTWMLTGSCESDNGMVHISGDIDTPFSVSCLNDSFSTGINYSVTSPYFISGSSVSRKIKISQGSSSDEVLLYKTSSSKPVNYLRNMTDIDNISDPAGIYILANDIDASNGGVNLVNNFFPISTAPDFFHGVIEGDNHSIINLNRTTGFWSSCLFDVVATGAVFKNIKLTNVNLSTDIYGAASTNIGTLFCNGFTSVDPEILIENVYIQGQMASLDPDTRMGGVYAASFGYVRMVNVVTEVNFTGTAKNVGGITAGFYSGIMTNTYSNSQIHVTTTASNGSGGLVGQLGSGSTTASIINSYFIGTIDSSSIIGGLVGYLGANGQSIRKSYSLANITVPATKVGGPILGSAGSYTYTFEENYYSSTQSCTLCTNSLGTAKTDAELKMPVTYSGWDFVNIWKIVEGVSYPGL